MVFDYYLIEKFHMISTSIMVGVILVIQLLHYPAFFFIEKNEFKYFHEFHVKNISIIVFPAMLIELLTGILMLYFIKFSSLKFTVSIFLLLVCWAVTIFYFLKVHNFLSQGFNENLIKQMINFNWVRTFCWVSRLIVLAL